MENYKIGYIFDMTTGELLGSEVVYLEKATGTYPHARNVTLVRPPMTGEHETAIWNYGKECWDKVADFRGMPWWNSDGTAGGIIDRLGDTDRILTEPPEKGEHEKLEWKNGSWQKSPADGWIADKTTGEIREMTQVEKIYAGLEHLPEGWKIDAGEIVPKSMDELYDEGAVTLEEYNDYIRRCRELEYRKTTDKIGLMVLRGEATEREWKDAILAVKVKWPYKEA